MANKVQMKGGKAWKAVRRAQLCALYAIEIHTWAGTHLRKMYVAMRRAVELAIVAFSAHDAIVQDLGPCDTSYRKSICQTRIMEWIVQAWLRR
jgi:hypothetical protein